MARASNNSNDCHDCYEFEERISIMTEQADVDERDIYQDARLSTCRGCMGRRRIGLFDGK